MQLGFRCLSWCLYRFHGHTSGPRGLKFCMDDPWVWGKVFHYSNIRKSKFEFFRIFLIFANQGHYSGPRGLKFRMDDPWMWPRSSTIRIFENQSSDFPNFPNFSNFFQFFRTFRFIANHGHSSGPRGLKFRMELSSDCGRGFPLFKYSKIEVQIFPNFSNFSNFSELFELLQNTVIPVVQGD